MQQITLHCAGMDARQQLHTALAEALHFPQWYGHNLDALYDCLTELELPLQLTLTGWQQLPDWKDGFAAVFTDVKSEYPGFTVIFA